MKDYLAPKENAWGGPGNRVHQSCRPPGCVVNGVICAKRNRMGVKKAKEMPSAGQERKAHWALTNTFAALRRFLESGNPADSISRK
jgi:hypothetical protein